MGIKTIKARYGLGDMLVHKVPTGIAFGTEMAPQVVVVSKEGKILEASKGSIRRFYEQLENSIQNDPEGFVGALEQEEDISHPLPVFTYVDGKVLEKSCEEHGWPNLTTDGELMYENTHFANRQDCLEQAEATLRARVESGIDRVKELSNALSDEETRLQQAWKELSSLEDELCHKEQIIL